MYVIIIKNNQVLSMAKVKGDREAVALAADVAADCKALGARAAICYDCGDADSAQNMRDFLRFLIEEEMPEVANV